jgi:hypothetical protein
MLEEAAKWAADEWLRRTREINAGRGQIYWAHPHYRISWSDIQNQFPWVTHTHRVPFQTAWKAELSRRKIRL